MRGCGGIAGVGLRVSGSGVLCFTIVVFIMHMGVYSSGGIGGPLAPEHRMFRIGYGFTLSSVVALNHTTKVDTGTPPGCSCTRGGWQRADTG